MFENLFRFWKFPCTLHVAGLEFGLHSWRIRFVLHFWVLTAGRMENQISFMVKSVQNTEGLEWENSGESRDGNAPTGPTQTRTQGQASLIDGIVRKYAIRNVSSHVFLSQLTWTENPAWTGLSLFSPVSRAFALLCYFPRFETNLVAC